MKKLMQRLLASLVLVVVTFGSAHAVLLSTLVEEGDWITAGDKKFDGWFYRPISITDPGFDASQIIDVVPLSDGGLDPGPGLAFSASGLTVSGFAWTEFTIGFHVSVLDPNLRIKDNSLDLTGFILGAGSNSDYVYVSIHESVGTSPGANDLGEKDVWASWINGSLSLQLSDSAEFAPQSEIWVEKYITVFADGEDSDARATLVGFEQRFSQQVPEPGTLALLGLGMAGLMAHRRRRR